MNRQTVSPQRWLHIANERLLEIPEVPRCVCYIKVEVLPSGAHSASAEGLSELINQRQRAVLLKLLKAIADEVSLDYKIL